eukprot:10805846-Karenia_brevis.AAC.1
MVPRFHNFCGSNIGNADNSENRDNGDNTEICDFAINGDNIVYGCFAEHEPMDGTVKGSFGKGP